MLKRLLAATILVGVCRAAFVWGYPLPVGPQFLANTQTAGIQIFPQVQAVGSDGFVVVWTDRSARDGSGFGVFGRRIDSLGDPIGGDFAVNTYTTGDQVGGVVGSDASGNFVVVWTDQSGRDGDGWGVVARRFTSTGMPVGSDFLVNTSTVGFQGGPNVTVDTNGHFLVTWYSEEDAPEDSLVLAQRFDASGNPQGSEFQVNTTSPVSFPTATVDSSGNFTVLWFDGDEFRVQRLDSSGAPIGGEVVVMTGGSADVAFDAAGNMVFVWSEWTGTDRGRHDVFAQRVSNAGSALGAPFQVNTFTMGSQVEPHVAMSPSGDFVVAFTSPRGYQINLSYGYSATGRRVDARRFDAAGNPLVSDFGVSTAPILHSLGSGGVDIAAAPDGEFMVVWNSPEAGDKYDPDDIGARRFAHLAPAAASKVLLADNATNPTRRKIVVKLLDPFLSTNPGAGVNPIADGAYLHVYNAAGTGDSACIPLPAAYWSIVGDPGQPTYKYRDPLGAGGPCKSLSIKNGKLLKAACKATLQPIAYSLDEPQQNDVAVRFVSGDATYCVLAVSALTDAPGRYLARNAPAPVVCPDPPSPCP